MDVALHFGYYACPVILFECRQRLCEVVGNHMVDTGRYERKGLPIDISLMMTLWILATTDTFRSVGVKFGLKKGSVHNQYKTLIAVLRELRVRYIKWPSLLEQEVIARRFEDSYGYPGVVGCIDCTHIKIYKPLEQPVRYINRHHDHSILVQAVCDVDLLFRDVHSGQPGALGDARTYDRSPFGDLMGRQVNFIGDDKHVLGDGAYTLTTRV